MVAFHFAQTKLDLPKSKQWFVSSRAILFQHWLKAHVHTFEMNSDVGIEDQEFLIDYQNHELSPPPWQ